MGSPQHPAPQESVSRDDIAVALSLARIAIKWSLTPARWAAVGRSAVAVTAALATDDAETAVPRADPS
jgi:hypothetical protein